MGIAYKNTFYSMRGQSVKSWAQVMNETNTSIHLWRKENQFFMWIEMTKRNLPLKTRQGHAINKKACCKNNINP